MIELLKRLQGLALPVSWCAGPNSADPPLKIARNQDMTASYLMRNMIWSIACLGAFCATAAVAAPEQILVGTIYTSQTAAPVAEAVTEGLRTIAG